jgi:O-glycosyl hydrolase
VCALGAGGGARGQTPTDASSGAAQEPNPPASDLNQAEVGGWGGLRGICVDGQLMELRTGLRAVASNAPVVNLSNPERLSFPRLSREGRKQVCSGGLWAASNAGGAAGAFRGRRGGSDLTCSVAFEDVAAGAVRISVEALAKTNLDLTGVFFYAHLPGPDYSLGSVEFVGELPGQPQNSVPKPVRREAEARSVRFVSQRRQLEIAFDAPERIAIEEENQRGGTNLLVYFPVSTGALTNGAAARLQFLLKLTGVVDKSPVKLTVDAAKPGGPFEGVGGNFRLQSPLDPAQIAYNLEHLRVAWARVAMPLDLWWPNEAENALERAAAGHIDPAVSNAMQMAGTLAQKRIPLIVSVWQAPAWALAANEPYARGFEPNRPRRINPEKWDALCNAIGSYLECMKAKFGAEPKLFSFNESDIGVNVLQSPEEHDSAIKRLGAYFAGRKLGTKMLLGDTGNPTAVSFIQPALRDPDAAKYIGAVSFHAWNGGNAQQYAQWHDAAQALGVPLLVAEGGTDPGAYAYPSVFQQSWYAVDEIAQYITICRIAQPQSILQWQLTADYALLAGGTDGQPLAPTQRFWQLKQLDTTPQGARAWPVTVDQAAVSACAFGGPSAAACVIHVVNMGASREAAISGLPASLKRLRACVTDSTRAMKELPPVAVSDGVAHLQLPAMSYLTLAAE